MRLSTDRWGTYEERKTWHHGPAYGQETGWHSLPVEGDNQAIFFLKNNIYCFEWWYSYSAADSTSAVSGARASAKSSEFNAVSAPPATGLKVLRKQDDAKGTKISTKTRLECA